MIQWNRQSLQWFADASEYTGYNKKLAEILLRQIPCRGTLCDLGCGAGLIDFELAPHIGQITCVDISPEAVNAVAEGARQRGISNISARCMDAEKLAGQWDTVLALFHGGADFYTRYRHLAKDRLILAAPEERKGGFGPEGKKADKHFDVAGVKYYLNALGASYELLELALEYGQPFPDLKDAERFVRTYSMPLDDRELRAYLNEKIETTGDRRFPYYLPNLKKIGLFIITVEGERK